MRLKYYDFALEDLKENGYLKEYISDTIINQLRLEHPFVNNSIDHMYNFITKDLYNIGCSSIDPSDIIILS